MSLDKRVKDALERTSQIVDPDVRRDLSSVRRKTRRAVIRQRITVTLVAASLAALAVFLGPRVLDVIRSQRHVPANPPSVAAGPLPGSYRVDLTGAGRIDLIVQSRRSVEHDVQRRRLDRMESASGLRPDRGPAARYVSGIGNDVLHEPVRQEPLSGLRDRNL